MYLFLEIWLLKAALKSTGIFVVYVLEIHTAWIPVSSQVLTLLSYPCDPY